MTAHLIAHTTLEVTEHGYDGPERYAIEDFLERRDPLWREADGDALAEFSGRACYQSWNRPNEKTASNQGYLANIIDIGHESVLSHAAATFYITDVSRSLTHELVRHRWMSFSQLSQRYVDQSAIGIVMPPVLRSEENADLRKLITDHATYATHLYTIIADRLVERGSPRKEARGAARSVLPEATSTAIVVSTNFRGWRDFLKQRLSPAADQEIRELAEEILQHLLGIAPNTFQDFKVGGE